MIIAPIYVKVIYLPPCRLRCLASEKRWLTWALIRSMYKRDGPRRGSPLPTTSRRVAAALNIWMNIRINQIYFRAKGFIQPHRAIIMDSITTFSLSPPEFHEGSHSPTLVSFDNSWIPEPCFFVAATFETWYFVQSPRRLQTLADLNVGPNESIHDHIRLRHYSA